ncbi:GlxA family transcriptional regulator [Salinimonas lutimaris]|uniref:GlxA family transcriptional regulator n=1 Tax=Salinimonas lutimaris TaxID=914153 RepID=UPI001C3069EE|nr:helix-turn-helix domain-containing protein [Salinimonas lutimaris]
MMTMTRIIVVNYPGASVSAVHGLQELFALSNNAALTLEQGHQFTCSIVNADQIANEPVPPADYILLPPALDDAFYVQPADTLCRWLISHYEAGAVLASACAGAFILARAGLLDNKRCTTHWGLAGKFKDSFSHLSLQPDAILINEGSVITSGGMMSWIDLGLEIVGQSASARQMQLTGKWLVVDTGAREQLFYRRFTPDFSHGDKPVIEAQHYIAEHMQLHLDNQILANYIHLSTRTLQRRFVAATGLSVKEYVQAVRIQQACDLLESDNSTIEHISLCVGYYNVAAFRKVFKRILGLTPTAFRQRFNKHGTKPGR